MLTRDDGVSLGYPGRINVLFGETESLKSWAAGIASTQQLDLGHHVMYVDFGDGPETIVERLRALGVATDTILDYFSYIQPTGPFDDDARESVEALIQRRGVPTLVVVDAMTEAMAQMDLDPMVGTDVTTFYSGWPAWFKRTGAAVTLLDHVTKSREGRGRWAIGSERKLSGIDGAAIAFDVLEPFGRGRTGRVRLSVSKDRPGHVRAYQQAGGTVAVMELRSYPDGGVMYSLEAPAERSDTFRPTVLMEKLSRAIEETPGLGKRALLGAVPGKQDAKYLALELLVAEGYVRVEPGVRGGQLHHPVRPFAGDLEVAEDVTF